jgi:hypothetical protein
MYEDLRNILSNESLLLPYALHLAEHINSSDCKLAGFFFKKGEMRDGGNGKP